MSIDGMDMGTCFLNSYLRCNYVNPLICILGCNIALKPFNVNTETIKLAGEVLLPSAFCEQPGLSTQLLAML